MNHLLIVSRIIYRFSQAYKWSSHLFFFLHISRAQALPQPGLEPGSSDSEPSALTTGLLDKAVALAYPWNSWPRMLKGAPCTVVRSYNQIFLAWWVITILYNYGATLCKLRYKNWKSERCGDKIIEISSLSSACSSLEFHSLSQMANTWKISCKTLYSGQFILPTQLIILNYPAILSHWCSTTVSLETYPLLFTALI